VSCFVYLALTFQKVRLSSIVVALLWIIALMSITLLTGRRKSLVEVAIFLSVYQLLNVYFLRNKMGTLSVVMIATSLVYFGFQFFAVDGMNSGVESMEAFQAYLRRGKTGFGDSSSRFNDLGLDPIIWSFKQFGWLGIGLGPGSPGGNLASFDASGFEFGAAEGGLGKITMELGIPGLLIIAWGVWTLIRYCLWIFHLVSKTSNVVSRLAIGLMAFLLANIAAFSVATQVYGDVFILLVLGLMFGFFLATPVLADRIYLHHKELARRKSLLNDAPNISSQSHRAG